MPRKRGKTAGSLEVGETVTLTEGGQNVEFIVVHQGLPSAIYDTSCDGTWLLRKELYSDRAWDAGNVNNYEESDIDAWLNSDYLKSFEPNIRNAIKQAKIPYRSGGGYYGTDKSGASGLSRKTFLLSGYEVGWTKSISSMFPHDGDVLAYFKGTSEVDSKRIAYLKGLAARWWLRSPYTDNANNIWYVSSSGDWYYGYASLTCGIRPAFILPSSFTIPKI